MSAWVGNVAYLVLLFSTLGYFFPTFEGGATVSAVVGASILLWVVHAMVLRGIETAALANTIVTIAKIVPILTFVAIAAVGFRAGVFTADFWGQNTQIDGAPLGSTLDQVKNMMLVTVWVFIGIEGASVYSKRAGKRKDVGLATVIGFAGVLVLLLSGQPAVLRPDGPGGHRRARATRRWPVSSRTRWAAGVPGSSPSA